MRISGVLVTGLIAFCVCLSACTSHAPRMLKSSQDPAEIKVIALLPVECRAADAKVSRMLREKLFKELQFKGYPSVAADLIDSKLMPMTGSKDAVKTAVIAPKAIEELLGADGAMYCSLKESETSTKLFYAPVTISVSCELRSTKTGEMLWNAQHKTTNRSFDFFRTRLDMKSRGDLESAMEEAVTKVMETLPYGPKLRG